MSRLVDQIKQALAAFVGCKTMPALIGGLALAAHEVVRATRDVDFLADAEDAERLHDALIAPEACRALVVEARIRLYEDRFLAICGSIVVLWTKNRRKYGPYSRIRRPANQSPTDS